MEQVHVTQLTRFNKCPGDYMYNDSSPELKNTYKGDVLNVAVNSFGALGPFLKAYSKYITSDFKELEKLKKVIVDARWYAYMKKKFIEDMIENWVEKAGYWQEPKMLLPWSDDYTIVGSLDFLWNEWDWYVIEDFKYSTHSRYSNEEILAADCQKVAYPLAVMNYFEIDEVLFRFKVWDKTNLKAKYCGEEVMTRAYCQKYIDDVMTRYAEAKKKNEFPDCNKHSCFYCGPKMRWQNSNSDDGDEFDF